MHPADPRPRRLELHLSYDCVQRCVFCSESDRMARFQDAHVRPAEIAEVLIRKRRQGFDHLTLTGGEPTVYPGFVEVLSAAKLLGFRTYVTSNGSRLADPAFAGRSLALIDELCLSIHGGDAWTHDASAGCRGSFQSVWAALENAAGRSGTYLLTNTVATTMNVDRLPDTLARLISSRTARHCLISNLAPEGRGAGDYARLAVPLSLWKALIPRLARLADGTGVVLRFFGLPLCVFGENGDLSNDLHWSPRVTVERALRAGRSVLVEIESAAPTRRRRHPAACALCALRGLCAGVFDAYVESFGSAELEPQAGGMRG